MEIWVYVSSLWIRKISLLAADKLSQSQKNVFEGKPSRHWAESKKKTREPAECFLLFALQSPVPCLRLVLFNQAYSISSHEDTVFLKH